MSSLVRRTLATTATVAGVAALGAAFAGQAFAADLPTLPELPTGAATLPEAPSPGAPSLPSPDSAHELPTDFDSFSVPGVANLEAPNVSVDSSGNTSSAGDIPAASHEAAHEAALPELPALPQDHLPTTVGEFATPQAALPLAGPELPELPSTADQDLDTQDTMLPTSDLAAPSAGDVASQIAALAG
ncbi:hypothetical protein ACL02T_13605 [Pseudonocardia sp. RS010]|uniref:hypothetical protein n=1 Tax=Pseudonocardia sp. RS010 TaxID=3385979 RepID=UPI0039A0F5AE